MSNHRTILQHDDDSARKNSHVVHQLSHEVMAGPLGYWESEEARRILGETAYPGCPRCDTTAVRP